MKSPRTLTLPIKFYVLVENCPNFHKSGSITGMRRQFYGLAAQLIRCGSHIYNVTGCREFRRIIQESK